MNWRPLSVRSAFIVPQRDVHCSKTASATNSAVGSGSAMSSTYLVWWSISTSVRVCPLAVGLSGPKTSPATISKGMQIGRLNQRQGLENCVLAIHKVHRLETHGRWRAAEASITAVLGPRMSWPAQNVPRNSYISPHGLQRRTSPGAAPNWPFTVLGKAAGYGPDDRPTCRCT